MKQVWPRVRMSSVRLKADAIPAARRDAGFNATAPYVAGDPGVDTMAGLSSRRHGGRMRRSAGTAAGSRRGARDLARNNGWAAGAVAKEVAGVIGANFRPFAKPDWRALGLDEDWARAFKDAVADLCRRSALSCRHHAFADGAADVRHGAPYVSDRRRGTGRGGLAAQAPGAHRRLRLVDPDLLSNPDNIEDTHLRRGGIDLTPYGAAWGYNFRQRHPRHRMGRYGRLPLEGDQAGDPPRAAHCHPILRQTSRRPDPAGCRAWPTDRGAAAHGKTIIPGSSCRPP